MIRTVSVALGFVLLTFLAACAVYRETSIKENEASAIKQLQAIHEYEQIAYNTKKRYLALPELFAGDNAIFSPERSNLGYRFKININDNGNSWEASVIPVDYGRTGRLSFYCSQNGVIHLADKHGGEASESDPELK